MTTSQQTNYQHAKQLFGWTTEQAAHAAAAHYLLHNGPGTTREQIVDHLRIYLHERVEPAPDLATIREYVDNFFGGLKPQSSAGEYLTDAQFRELIGGIDVSTTARWRRDGKGPPFVRSGPRKVLYRRSDIDAWLASRTFEHLAAEATAPKSR